MDDKYIVAIILLIFFLAFIIGNSLNVQKGVSFLKSSPFTRPAGGRIVWNIIGKAIDSLAYQRMRKKVTIITMERYLYFLHP